MHIHRMMTMGDGSELCRDCEYREGPETCEFPEGILHAADCQCANGYAISTPRRMPYRQYVREGWGYDAAILAARVNPTPHNVERRERRRVEYYATIRP